MSTIPHGGKRPTVIIVDDHAVVAEGVRAILEPQFLVLAVVTESDAAPASVATHDPDGIVLDIAMHGTNGIDLARRFHRADPDLAIVMLTMHSERHHVDEALRAGARGFVPKLAPGEEVRFALQEAMKGRTYVSPQLTSWHGRGTGVPMSNDGLTTRQMQVLRGLAEGRSSQDIAEQLAITPKTVEYHRDSVKKRLGIRSTAGLVRYALDHGVLD